MENNPGWILELGLNEPSERFIGIIEGFMEKIFLKNSGSPYWEMTREVVVVTAEEIRAGMSEGVHVWILVRITR